MPFSPTGIAGLFAWYVADNINIANNAAVNSWPDASTSANNATPPVPANAPTYQTNVINGHAAVLFSSGQYLEVPYNASLGVSASDNTAFVVYNTLDVRDSQAIVSLYDTFTTAFSVALNSISGRQFSHINDNITINTPSGGYTNNQWILRYDVNDNSVLLSEIYVSGVLLASGSVTFNIPSSPVLDIGYAGLNNTLYYSGYIAEIALYNRGLTSTEQSQVNSYLSNKYFSTPLPTNPVATSSTLIETTNLNSTLYVYKYGTTNFVESTDLSATVGKNTVIYPPTAGYYSDFLSQRYFQQDYFDISQPHAVTGVAINQVSTSAAIVETTDFATTINKKAATFAGIAEQTDLNVITKLNKTANVNLSVATNLAAAVAQKSALRQNLTVDTVVQATTIGGSSFVPPLAPSFFQPTNISGLCFWFRSTSIGVNTDGSPVQYWQDDSGSGNHLSANLAQSGQWVFPQLYTKMINGYPIVRFVNGNYYSYLKGNFNASLSMPASSLTTFCVFRTIDGSTEQSIYSADNGSNSIFNIGLNYNHNNSFYFTYGNNVTNNLVANSPTFGTNLYDVNNFMIRHDRFRRDGEFMFGRYGPDVASGTSSTLTTNSGEFLLGYNRPYGTAFYGDVAEIIGYNRSLSDSDIENIETYLTVKYLPPNANSVPLFTFADANSGIYSDISLYLYSNYSGVQASPTLYTASTLTVNSGLDLYSYSVGTPQNNIPLYTSQSYQQASTPLYTISIAQTGGSIPLYTNSARFSTNNISLYASGSPLPTGAIYQSSTTLYIGSTPTLPQSNIYLYTAGWTPPVASTGMPLFVFSTSAGTNGIYDGITAYLEAGKTSQYMPLYLDAAGSSSGVGENSPSGWMPLFIGSPYVTGVYTGNFSLYMANNVSGFSSPLKRLFIQGDGQLDGGYIYSSPDMYLTVAGI